MIHDEARIRALRIRILRLVGAFGWTMFAATVIGHIYGGLTADEPPIYWLLDWHVHYLGAIDLLERDLYRAPLVLSDWPLPTPVFNLPPGAAAIAVPFLALGRETGGIAWIVLGMLALAAAALLAVRLLRIEHGWAWLGLAFWGYTGVYYFVGHVVLGNVNHFMLALLTIFAWAHLGDRQRIAGIALGAAVAIKAWPLTLLVFVVRERRWQEMRWAIGLLSVQGLLTIAWLGPDVLGPMVAAVRTDLPLDPDAVFMWTTWTREILGTPDWLPLLVSAALLLIPARGALGLGLGLLAGLTLINNIWNHYLPTFVLAAVLMMLGITRTLASGTDRVGPPRLRESVPSRSSDRSAPTALGG